MILGELYKLYHLISARGGVLPRRGWSIQKVSFRVVITESGDFVRIEDARELQPRGPKKKLTSESREMTLPGEGKPSGSGVNPCFLWDNGAYMLGAVAVKPRAIEYFEEFRKKHLGLEAEINCPAFSSVCRFLEKWREDMCLEHFTDKALFTGNGVFRVLGNMHDVHEDETIVRWWNSVGCTTWREGEASETGICLITGQLGPIAMLHEPVIKGVVGAQSSGAKLVSFNCKSFESYGKEQSVNSPVSQEAAFAYCNALNYLLGSSSNRLRIGDATTVFWTDAPPERSEELELIALTSMEVAPREGQDEALLQRVGHLLRDIADGKDSSVVLHGTEGVHFYILGLSPNASRLSVRFFYESSFGDFIKNIAKHYQALRLVPRGEKFKDPEFISPFLILRETARESKDVPPSFGGALMRAVLSALPYPDSIAIAILRRMRTDHFVNYVRCSYLKAWLTRKLPNEHITTMLDTNNNHPGYLLGRVFAVLQKTQEDALPDINRTLQEAFYASASTSPRSVFPRLLKLSRHHLAKLPIGRRIVREKLLQEIMASLAEIPARLNLAEQSFFALGFYHQTQDFYLPSSQPQS